MSGFAQTLPPLPSTNDSTGQENKVYQFEAPSNNPPSPRPPADNNRRPSANRLFRVQVYGSSEQLLSLVRRVEPKAFVPEGKQIIQVGLFSQADNARELVQDLSEQGIEADIIQIRQSQNRSSKSSSSRDIIALSSASGESKASQTTKQPIPLTVDSSANPTKRDNHTEKATRGYYVVIPSSDETVSKTAQTVVEAGVRQTLIQQRDAPRGTHVAVGPFKNRNQASRWRSQLQTEGLDARVYFGQ